MLNIEEKYLWPEKYRPKELKDLIISDDRREFFQNCIDNQELPNMLFYGPPGGGKSTLARILINSVLKSRSDLWAYNGSSKTGVDYIRNILDSFCTTSKISKHKIVFIEEFQRMSPQAQESLKNPMEEYHENVRFIFTTNVIDKVDSAIKSRCQSFDFSSINKSEMKKQITNILKEEQVEYKEESIDRIIREFYPDFRFIINLLQSRIVKNKLSTEIDNIVSNEKIILKNISDLISLMSIKDEQGIIKKIDDINKLVCDNEIKFEFLFEDIFKDPIIPIWIKPIICKYADKHPTCVSELMNFMSMIYSIYESYKFNIKVFS